MSATAPFDAYIICATPRSGSTLLCDMLEATGIAGVPDSYLMADPDPKWISEWGLPDPSQAGRPGYANKLITAVLQAGRGNTDIFGLRLMQQDLARTQSLLAHSVPNLDDTRARFEAAFGRCLFIHLTRADKLAQAISLVRARQSGLWHRNADGSERERLAPPTPETYMPGAIANALAALEDQDQAWLDWFAAHEIAPLRIVYEQMANAPQDALVQILDALGLTLPVDQRAQVTLARLADTTSRDWATRFRKTGASG